MKNEKRRRIFGDDESEEEEQEEETRLNANKKLKVEQKAQQVQGILEQKNQKDGMIAFLTMEDQKLEDEEQEEEENEEEDEDEEDSFEQNIVDGTQVNRKRDKKDKWVNQMVNFKNDDDFYIQTCREREQREKQQSGQLKIIMNVVDQRQGKLISSNISQGLFTVACFKNHVFDCDLDNLKNKWCPMCYVLLQQVMTQVENNQGLVESEFYEKQISVRCKYFHRWKQNEDTLHKIKEWCPKCPEVLNLMIEHHHKGYNTIEEKLIQIKSEARVIAQGFFDTNLKFKQSQQKTLNGNRKIQDGEEDEDSFLLEKISEIYFLAILDPSMYRSYLMSLTKEEQQTLFREKYDEITSSPSSDHPISDIALRRFMSIFSTVLPNQKETKEYLRQREEEEKEKQEAQQQQKESSTIEEK